MLPPSFKTARKLKNKVAAYFRYIEGEYHTEIKSGKEEKKYTREPEPATISGLALFVGFNSRQELDDYELRGEFCHTIRRGCLKVESLYEKELHQKSPSGAVFALKNRRWHEKTDDRLINVTQINSLEIVMVETGPKIATNEAEVVI